MHTNLKNYPNTPNFTDRMIVSITPGSGYLVLRTFDSCHRWSKNLYISTTMLARWLAGDHGSHFIEDDMDNVIRIWHGSDDELNVEIIWLDNICCEELHGHKQSFYIPATFLEAAVQQGKEGSTVRCLGKYKGRTGQARLLFSSSAQEQIGKMTPQQRNTLRKAMRQAFTWGRHTTVRIYAEYGVDFYFREDDGICGGLLISKNTITGKDQQRYSKYSYSIHT